ncbi:hypothetical protein AYI68_g8054 [Smittium mucronatum]|uniref:CSC1/OSCA1-like cytosolic domain-containing protein n=1 Tax=Smittium mucronatum TaxID=133383 RepID=A0A1R0GLY2_9FUNG|nr:hypothetical protein AYI68_g8054 [Smittium mucronatum]
MAVFVRQRYLNSYAHLETLKSRTVLVTGIPKIKNNVNGIKSEFEEEFGKIKEIHMCCFSDTLYENTKTRDRVRNELENKLTYLSKKTTLLDRKYVYNIMHGKYKKVSNPAAEYKLQNESQNSSPDHITIKSEEENDFKGEVEVEENILKNDILTPRPLLFPGSTTVPLSSTIHNSNEMNDFNFNNTKNKGDIQSADGESDPKLTPSHISKNKINSKPNSGYSNIISKGGKKCVPIRSSSMNNKSTKNVKVENTPPNLDAGETFFHDNHVVEIQLLPAGTKPTSQKNLKKKKLHYDDNKSDSEITLKDQISESQIDPNDPKGQIEKLIENEMVYLNSKVKKIVQRNKKVQKINLKMRDNIEVSKSALLVFDTMEDAHSFAYGKNNSSGQDFSPRYVDIDPSQVIWENLDITAEDREILAILSGIAPIVFGILIQSEKLPYVGFVEIGYSSYNINIAKPGKCSKSTILVRSSSFKSSE